MAVAPARDEWFDRLMRVLDEYDDDLIERWAFADDDIDVLLRDYTTPTA